MWLRQPRGLFCHLVWLRRRSSWNSETVQCSVRYKQRELGLLMGGIHLGRNDVCRLTYSSSYTDGGREDCWGCKSSPSVWCSDRIKAHFNCSKLVPLQDLNIFCFSWGTLCLDFLPVLWLRQNCVDYIVFLFRFLLNQLTREWRGREGNACRYRLHRLHDCYYAGANRFTIA